MKISMRHGHTCAGCDITIWSSSNKWAYFWLLLHLKFTCPKPPRDHIPLIATIWQLLWWKSPY